MSYKLFNQFFFQKFRPILSTFYGCSGFEPEPSFLSSVLALPSGGWGFPYLTLRLGQILALKLRYHPTFKEGWIKPSKGKAEPDLQR